MPTALAQEPKPQINISAPTNQDRNQNEQPISRAQQVQSPVNNNQYPQNQQPTNFRNPNIQNQNDYQPPPRNRNLNNNETAGLLEEEEPVVPVMSLLDQEIYNSMKKLNYWTMVAILFILMYYLCTCMLTYMCTTDDIEVTKFVGWCYLITLFLNLLLVLFNHNIASYYSISAISAMRFV